MTGSISNKRSQLCGSQQATLALEWQFTHQTAELLPTAVSAQTSQQRIYPYT